MNNSLTNEQYEDVAKLACEVAKAVSEHQMESAVVITLLMLGRGDLVEMFKEILAQRKEVV
jgi:hypothetical protein